MELVAGKKYKLKYNGEYCHSITSNGSIAFKEGIYEFIGQVKLLNGPRNIFYSSNIHLTSCYVMFGVSNLSYIEKEVYESNEKLLEKINKLEEEIKKIKNEILE